MLLRAFAFAHSNMDDSLQCLLLPLLSIVYATSMRGYERCSWLR